jgi:CRISPR-associated protein Cas5t
MTRLWLHVRAPFAAFRGMQAGEYRATAPTIPPSAALGLVLNLAGVETRDPRPSTTTLMRSDVPCLRIAIGACSDSEVSTLYQQLHSYLVGSPGQEKVKNRTHGAKYWIAPVRREVLVGLDVIVGVETPDGALLERVRRGLAGELDEERYGLPFAGDNSFLFDRIEILDAPPPVRWYARIEPGDPPRRKSARLTVGIDREDSSRTTSVLMAPEETPSSEPPERAWVWTPWAPAGVLS